MLIKEKVMIYLVRQLKNKIFKKVKVLIIFFFGDNNLMRMLILQLYMMNIYHSSRQRINSLLKKIQTEKTIKKRIIVMM